MNTNKTYVGADKEWVDKYGGLCKISHPFTHIYVCYYIPKGLQKDETVRFEFWNNETDKMIFKCNCMTYGDALLEYSKFNKNEAARESIGVNG